MEQGKLAKWLKKEGDKVSSGDAIAEIETDKATMEVEAVDEGVFGKIMIPEGSARRARESLIAILLAEGEDASRSHSGAAPAPASPAPWLRHPAAPADRASPLPGAEEQAEPSSAPAKPNGHGARLRLAAGTQHRDGEAGIELSLVKGSGPHGRIVEKDVGEAVAVRGARKAPARPLPTQNGAGAVPARAFLAAMPADQILALFEPGTYEIRPLDGMRKTIAQRLVESATTIPHFRLNWSAKSTRSSTHARAPQLALAEGGRAKRAYKLSVNDFIVKALGMALQRVPDANAIWTEPGILRYKPSDVGVAVAIEGGLFTPIIRGASTKTLAQISTR